MDAGKIMWMMYEHPECKFEDMAMDFMDIRKRIFTFPEMARRPTSSPSRPLRVPAPSARRSPSSPTKETGIKWPLADYALLPNMAIVDADNCMTAPRGLTAASGIDVMTHAIESYVSIMASDYTKGLSERAAKLVFENLPSTFTTAPRTRTPARRCTTPPAWPVWPSPTPSWASTTPWLTSSALSITCPTASLTPSS